MNHYSDEQYLACVEQSPTAVRQHDKAAWLALFADQSTVEDPVGSAPHIRHSGPENTGDPFGAFYETFIAPNQIRFHVERDFVLGSQVMRDLTIEIAMSETVTVRVPVHLLYELVEQDGVLKIARLAAHWELRPMLLQQLRSGPGFASVGMASGARMLRHLGLSGMSGFTRALWSVGEHGKRQVQEWVRCCNCKDTAGMQQLLSSQDIVVNVPGLDEGLPLEQLAIREGSIKVTKLLAAGSVVSATLYYSRENQVRRGVALFTIDPRRFLIVAATFYW